MIRDVASSTNLADALQTAVADEEPNQIATAIQAITDQQAEQAVIAELGNRLSDSAQQTSAIFALDALNHIDAVHQLGKFLANSKNNISIRTTVLGLLQAKFLNFPTETLTYLRQALDSAKPDFRERIQSTFEFAITETVGQESKPRQILTIAGVQPTHLKSVLSKKAEDIDGSTIPIPGIFAEALGLLAGQEAIDLLCQLLHFHQGEQLRAEQNASSGNGRSADQQLEIGVIQERIMLAAVNALRITESESAIHCLGNALVNNLNYKVQRQAADALGKLGFQACIPILLTALFTESNQALKQRIGDALKEIDGWHEKASQMVTLLSQSAVQRDQIDAKILLTAVQPRQDALTKEPHLLTDFLIHAAIQQFNDQRLLQIFAELIKTNSKNNASVISERLELYREKENVSEEILQALRVEIGGAQTLKPLLNKLEKNLLDYFQKPIDRLNTDTQTMWKQTVRLANLGFFVRILLNISIFVIGAYFMIDSYGRIVAGTLSPQQLTALMAVFIGGGVTMFATFFTLPLKQIKRAVTDVGLANVAFISYVHQILQISHTFSYFYLNGDISFTEIKRAAKQIEDTSYGAILTLNIAGSDGDQTQFDQALLERIQGISEEKDEHAPD